MKKIISILSIVLLLSCSSDSSTEEQGGSIIQPSLKLVKIAENDININFGTTTTFTYANGVVSSMEFSQNGTTFYDEKIEFIYSNNKIDKLIYTHLVHNLGYDKFSYQGDLITNTYSTRNSTTKNYNYQYNDLNQLIELKIFDKFDALLYGCNYIYDNNGNIYRDPTIPQSEIYNSVYDTFTYDDKKNPYVLIYTDSHLKINRLSKNNILKIVGFNDSPITTFEYAYNNDGYPIERIEKINGNPSKKTIYYYETF